MNLHLEKLLAAGLLLLLASCGSMPESPAGATASGGTPQAASASSPSPALDPELLAKLEDFYTNGMDKVDRGAYSEGIRQLVTVLAEAEAASLSAADAAVVAQAEQELTKIGAALSMDTGTEWQDADKNQIRASSLDVAAGEGITPSIILTVNIGAGRALIPGAPIFFEFIKGGGLLTSLSTTNDYGQANCSLARLDNPSQETVIRASLVYQVRGYSYRFQGVERSFVYVPPARRATILVLEKTADTVAADPVILDSVYNTLKDVAFDFSQYNGVLLGDDFARVFGGDPQAIRNMGLEKGVSYLVMVLNDGYYVNQVELGGKKYNIFKSQTTATTRIIRVEDGKIMYSGTAQAVPGQGGTLEKAVLDGFRNAARAMAQKIEQDMTAISEALTGAPE
jgi:hypothetical protein